MPPEKPSPAPKEIVEQQDQSIKARKNQLFEAQARDNAGGLKPFTVYLHQTPPTPMLPGVKVALWALAAVVALLFLGALLSGGRRRTTARGGTQVQPAARVIAAAGSPSRAGGVLGLADLSLFRVGERK